MKKLIALLLVLALGVTVSVFAVSATEPEIPAQLTSELTVDGGMTCQLYPQLLNKLKKEAMESEN